MLMHNSANNVDTVETHLSKLQLSGLLNYLNQFSEEKSMYRICNEAK